jgi:NAD(P)-dependent dehydrogenase (short-subunit alcohol dehydrogenase family)
MDEFAGKTVLITGGSTGMGRACAERFSRSGASVAILGNDDKSISDAVGAIGGAAIGILGDVRRAGRHGEGLWATPSSASAGSMFLSAAPASSATARLWIRLRTVWDEVLDGEPEGNLPCLEVCRYLRCVSAAGAQSC